MSRTVYADIIGICSINQPIRATTATALLAKLLSSLLECNQCIIHIPPLCEAVAPLSVSKLDLKLLSISMSLAGSQRKVEMNTDRFYKNQANEVAGSASTENPFLLKVMWKCRTSF